MSVIRTIRINTIISILRVTLGLLELMLFALLKRAFKVCSVITIIRVSKVVRIVRVVTAIRVVRSTTVIKIVTVAM